MTAKPKVAIRLGTEGKAQVRNDFREMADAGSTEAARLGRAFEAQSERIEREQKRLAATMAKIAAIAPQSAVQMRVNDATGTGFGQWEGSAVASAKFFTDAEDRARRLIAAVDPLFAAQDRYNREVAEANQLHEIGALTDVRYAQAIGVAKDRLDEATQAHLRHNGASRASAQASIQASQQVQDFIIQVGAGQSILVAGTQQLSQLAYVMQGTGGTAGKVASFIAGPYGAAFLGATTLIGLFAGSLLDSEEASDKAAGGNKRHKLSAEELTKAIRDLDDATRKQIETSEQREKIALLEAASLLNQAVATRELTKAKLEDALANAKIARENSAPGEDRALISLNDRRVSALEALLKTSAEDIDKAKDSVRSLMTPLLERGVDERLEATKRATGEYERSLGRLRSQLRLGQIDQRQFTAELEKATKARDKALETARKESAEGRRTPNMARGLQESGRAQILDFAKQYSGLHEVRDKGALKALFGESVDKAVSRVDPAKLAWCAAFVNAILASQGLPGTGSLSARSFLGWGAETKDPTKGDIVVAKRGDDPNAGHVGFFDGFDKNGNVRVFGGNTGNKVGTATIGKNDILGFRRAPDGADLFKAEQKAAEEAAKAVEQLRGDLEALIGRFDPARAAADDFAASLAKIDDLERAGLLSPSAAANFRLAAYQQEQKRKSDATDRFVDDLWKSRGVDVEGDWRKLIDSIEDKSKSYFENAEKNAERTEERLKSLRDVGADIVDDVLNPANWDDWGGNAQRVLTMVRDELVALALINPLKNVLFKQDNPTAGNLVGALTSLIGGGITGHAAGTHSFSGGLTWIAENGPEIVDLPRGSRITPAAETRRILSGGQSMPSVPVTIHIDATGADAAGLARVEGKLDELKRDLPGTIVSVVSDASQRRYFE